MSNLKPQTPEWPSYKAIQADYTAWKNPKYRRINLLTEFEEDYIKLSHYEYAFTTQFYITQALETSRYWFELAMSHYKA